MNKQNSNGVRRINKLIFFLKDSKDKVTHVVEGVTANRRYNNEISFHLNVYPPSDADTWPDQKLLDEEALDKPNFRTDAV